MVNFLLFYLLVPGSPAIFFTSFLSYFFFLSFCLYDNHHLPTSSLSYMGFFSKSDSTMAKPPAEAPPTTESTPDPDEPVRPGTSGTEVLLVNNRRRASTRLKDAQKKERDYKTKKRSAAARANYAEAVCVSFLPPPPHKH